MTGTNRGVRHLVRKPGRAGGPDRFYWQPASVLRAAGWRPQRLPDDPRMAAERAEELNREVDAWRRGEAPRNTPAAAAERARRRAAETLPGSVAALVRDYKASRFWTALKPRTQTEYSVYLDKIVDWAGEEQARHISPAAVQAFYEAELRREETRDGKAVVVETPAKAAAAVRVLRLLLENGIRLGYLPAGANPAKRPGISNSRKREPVIWTPEQVRHMAATADAMGWRSVGTAILLNEWIGQRESDILALAPWRVEAEALRITQGKRGRNVVLPVHMVPHLVARLKGEWERPGAVVSSEYLLLHEGTKKAWKLYTFSHVFADVRAKAAAGDEELGVVAMPSCANLRFMELRHTAVTRNHEAGVDELGIAGITGHSPRTVREILDRHYLVRTEKAAAAAFSKRLAAERRRI